MRFVHMFKVTILSVIMVLIATVPSRAGTLEVSVLDRDGNPVPEVAVYVMYRDSASHATQASAIMDQHDAQFVPHILVVQAGTSVEFPNSDVVAHHVYSFSKPNNFVLPLYKGDKHKPVTMAHNGIVTLGCNIHDHMLAYIVVVDSDVFGVTDENGKLSVAVNDAARNVSVNIWSPRIRDKELAQSIDNAAAADANVTFALQKKLRPPHNPGTESVQWSEY